MSNIWLLVEVHVAGTVKYVAVGQSISVGVHCGCSDC
jgi:hypothetical protein